MIRIKFGFLYFFLLYTYANISASGGDTIVISKPPNKTALNFTKQSSIFIDSSKTMSYNAILKNTRNFIPLTAFQFPSKYVRGKYSYWLHYKLRNNTTKEIEIGIDLGVFDSITTYVFKQNSLTQSLLHGNRVTPKNKEVTTLITLQLKPHSTYTIYSRISNEIEINRAITPQIVNPLHFQRSVLSRFLTIYSIQAAFLAMLFIVFVINILQFIINNNRAFLYYALYIAGIFAFFSRDFNCTSPLIILGFNTICENTFLSPIMIGNFSFYILFIMSFLDTKTKHKKLHKTLKICLFIGLVYLGIERLINYWSPNMAWNLYGYFKIIMLVVNLAIIFLIIKIKNQQPQPQGTRLNIGQDKPTGVNKLPFYILSGSLALIVSSLYTSFLSFKGVHFVNYLDTTYIPQYIGIFLELLLFSLGLGYKTKLIEYERRKAKSELALINQEIKHQKEISDFRNQFFTKITHEFRTPLTVILGMTDVLKSTVIKKGKEAKKSLELIRRNGKNLLQLINQLLDIAKVESGTMELTLEQTDIIFFVKYVSESHHSLAEAKNINLIVYSEIDSLEMDMDVNKMASIISNLLSNAIKFTGINGKIIVHLQKSKNEQLFIIKVQDNGIGLEKAEIPQLFNRFYQVNKQKIQKQKGTGIGLSLVKEFVTLMNGNIAAESTLGKGSTFIVEIPISNNAIKTVTSTLTAPDTSEKLEIEIPISTKEDKSSLPLVLIIEDNIDVAHYLKSCLKGKYQCMYAKDGNLGIEMAYESIPDIIISDVMMPEKDGFQVCSTLKKDPRTDHIPIILLTAKVTEEDRLTGLSHGADAYLAKPFNERELFIRLNQLLLIRKKLTDKIQREGLDIYTNNSTVSPESKFLKSVLKIIEENINNPDFGSEILAEKLHLSESQIYRKLKAITNKSTGVFIRSVRLQKAKIMLETTDLTISEIAYDSGFNNPSWFSRAFKEEYGFSPSNV